MGLNLPFSRRHLRALTVAGSVGLLIGAAAGSAWLGGAVTRDAQIREQAQSLKTQTNYSYAASQFRKMSGVSTPTVNEADLDRRAIALVMRHDSFTSPVEVMRIRQDTQRSNMFASLLRPTIRNRKAGADGAPVLQAGMDMGLLKESAFGRARPVTPFDMPNKSASDLDCLTQAVYYEARGEGEAGMRAVAQVIVNRVRHPAYPKTICNVVYQGALKRTGCQFSFTCNGAMGGRVEAWAWKRARSVAEDALDGYVMKPVGASTHFHTLNVAPSWANRLDKIATVGNHHFYQFRGSGARITLTASEINPSDTPLTALPAAPSETAVATTPVEGQPPEKDAALIDALNGTKEGGRNGATTKVVALDRPLKGTEAQAITQALKPKITASADTTAKP